MNSAQKKAVSNSILLLSDDDKAKVSAYCFTRHVSERSLDVDSIKVIISDDWQNDEREENLSRKRLWDHSISLTDEEEIHVASNDSEPFILDDPHERVLEAEEKAANNAEEKHMISLLRESISKLPPQQGVIMAYISTHDVDGWKMSKIARTIGMSPKNFIRLYHKAVINLKKLMYEGSRQKA